MSQVPRIKTITGKASKEDLAAQREYERLKKGFQNDRSKFAFGTPEAKKAWQERIRRTRSF